MKIDFSIQNKLSFMKECGITPNEHEVIIGILMAQDEECYWLDEKYEAEQQFPSHQPDTSYLIFLQNSLTKTGLRQILIDLQNKGLILKSCKLPDPNGTEGMNVNSVKFNKSILKKYIRHSGEMFWELYWAYPESIDVNGRLMSLRNTFGNGGWASVDEAASFYGSRIQYNAETHNHILNLIRDGSDKGLINMGIVKFLRGEEWRNLDQVINSKNFGVEYI